MKHGHMEGRTNERKDENYIPYLFGYKTGLSLSRISTNNQISPMQFCCYTDFTLPKQSQRSRSVL